MLLYKWCLFLMRMMSPLYVGLILNCLIGVSLSFPSTTSQNYSIHPTARSNFRRNVIHSPFAKNYTFQRTKASTETPRLSSPAPVHSGNESRRVFRKNSETQKRPNLNLSFKLKVRNGSDENSTIVYLPRLSRSMANFSANSVNRDVQPIIVSSHRRNLLDPEEYTTTRSRPPTRKSAGQNSEPRTGSNIQQKAARTNRPRIFRTRPTESLPKIVSKFSAQKIREAFETETPNEKLSSESVVSVNIRKSSKNGTNSKINASSRLIPTVSPKTARTRSLIRKNRRQGRYFKNADSDFPKPETTSESLVSVPTLYETTKISRVNNGLGRSNSLRNNKNLSPFMKNDSSSQDFSSSQTEEEKLLFDLGQSYYIKKANNLTIYEILKPRLKGSSNATESFVISSDQNSLSLKNDAAFHQIKDIDEQPSQSNPSLFNISENIINSTVVANEIQYSTTEYGNSVTTPPEGRNFDFKYMVRDQSGSVAESTDSATEISEERVKENESGYTEGYFTTQRTRNYLNVDKFRNQRREMKVGSSVSEEVSRQQEISTETPNNPVSTNTGRRKTSTENLPADSSEYITLYESESDSSRRAKMTENGRTGNVPHKTPKIDSKIFYDYFARRPVGNVTLQDYPYLEYRPGNMFRYSDVYQRKPLLDVVYTRSPPILRLTRKEEEMVTEETVIHPTTFNSLRTSVRVLSTYYPNRMQDVTMKFGNRIETTTVPSLLLHEKTSGDNRNEEDPDDAEFRDAIDPGFTMEKLAYLLIGTCCGLSILCLVVVVIAIKCRRAIVEKRLKAQFRKRMYQHERIKEMSTPWQQQMFDHFMYLHRRPGGSTCSSNTDSYNCHCVTWSLGARNLDATRPLCPPTGRGSLYLYGQKKLPFGAASTLRFESMLGRKRSTPEINHQQPKSEPHNSDSSHENDSLDLDSDSREGDGPKQCTCIDYNVWTMAPPTSAPRSYYTLCPNPPGRYLAGNCSQHHPLEMRTISRDVPPPVTGSNYLDRSEGVVYWSSNEERLI